MLPPFPRCSGRAYSSLKNRPSASAFPDSTIGSACTSTFSRFARRLLALRPAHSRSHQFVTAIRGLQTFRHLHACPGCFRLERSPGGPCTHWKSAALSRRTRKADVAVGGGGHSECRTLPGGFGLRWTPFVRQSEPLVKV